MSRPAKAVAPARDAEDTRARLLKAAGEVFAESGYYAATVRHICARAGTNIALVNYHFGDKLGLYTEVLLESVKLGHVDAIRTALDQGGSPENVLRALVKARMRGMSSGHISDRQFRIMIHELGRPTPVLSRIINDVTRPIYMRVLDLIGGIIGRPAAHEQTRLCAHSVMGQIMLYSLAGPVLTRLWPELKMTPEQVDHIADHIADFSLAYLKQLASKNAHTRTHEKGRKRA